MGHRTPLYDQHIAEAAKIVDFGGWDMPLHYGSQIEEHHAVRGACGMFDVSHMRICEVRGAGARDFLRGLLANDVQKLKTPGKALYSCLLKETGGILDDLIVYFLEPHWYRVVVNAATQDKDIAWMRGHAPADVTITPRPDLAMIAVQGPEARSKVVATFGLAEDFATLPVFQGRFAGSRFVARTGYTGEDGFEMMVEASAASDDWHALRRAGVRPCGLGARDTLRLEAGMNLYGSDMDETNTPLECGLAWTVAFEPADRPFVGRAALEAQRAQGPSVQLLGVFLGPGQGVLRAHQKVRVAQGMGELTSGSFSPTLGGSVGFARLPASASAGERCEVDIRGRWVSAHLVRPPFVRQGKPMMGEIA